jgi:hypothetical protein
MIPVCLRMYDALLMPVVTSRLQDKARKAGQSPILSLYCPNEMSANLRHNRAVLTLPCLVMKTNGSILRVPPSERYQARSQSLSLRTCHDFSMCASQQTGSHAIILSSRLVVARVSNANQAIIPTLRTTTIQSVFLPNTCVSSCARPISRTQFNQRSNELEPPIRTSSFRRCTSIAKVYNVFPTAARQTFCVPHVPTTTVSNNKSVQCRSNKTHGMCRSQFNQSGVLVLSWISGLLPETTMNQRFPRSKFMCPM